jgi:hypothetical protein
LSLPAAAGESVKNAMPGFAIPWRDVFRHVQGARKRVPPLHERNTDWQSVRPRPAEFHSAEPAANRQLCL